MQKAGRHVVIENYDEEEFMTDDAIDLSADDEDLTDVVSSPDTSSDFEQTSDFETDLDAPALTPTFGASETMKVINANTSKALAENELTYGILTIKEASEFGEVLPESYDQRKYVKRGGKSFGRTSWFLTMVEQHDETKVLFMEEWKNERYRGRIIPILIGGTSRFLIEKNDVILGTEHLYTTRDYDTSRMGFFCVFRFVSTSEYRSIVRISMYRYTYREDVLYVRVQLIYSTEVRSPVRKGTIVAEIALGCAVCCVNDDAGMYPHMLVLPSFGLLGRTSLQNPRFVSLSNYRKVKNVQISRFSGNSNYFFIATSEGRLPSNPETNPAIYVYVFDQRVHDQLLNLNQTFVWSPDHIIEPKTLKFEQTNTNLFSVRSVDAKEPKHGFRMHAFLDNVVVQTKVGSRKILTLHYKVPQPFDTHSSTVHDAYRYQNIAAPLNKLMPFHTDIFFHRVMGNVIIDDVIYDTSREKYFSLPILIYIVAHVRSKQHNDRVLHGQICNSLAFMKIDLNREREMRIYMGKISMTPGNDMFEDTFMQKAIVMETTNDVSLQELARIISEAIGSNFMHVQRLVMSKHHTIVITKSLVFICFSKYSPDYENERVYSEPS